MARQDSELLCIDHTWSSLFDQDTGGTWEMRGFPNSSSFPTDTPSFNLVWSCPPRDIKPTGRQELRKKRKQMAKGEKREKKKPSTSGNLLERGHNSITSKILKNTNKKKTTKQQLKNFYCFPFFSKKRTLKKQIKMTPVKLKKVWKNL